MCDIDTIPEAQSAQAGRERSSKIITGFEECMYLSVASLCEVVLENSPGHEVEIPAGLHWQLGIAQPLTKAHGVNQLVKEETDKSLCGVCGAVLAASSRVYLAASLLRKTPRASWRWLID